MAESLVRPLGQDASNRAAVVAFAGRGVLRCPLTENLGAVLDALHRLRPGSVQPGGTDLGAALDAAIEAVAVDPQEHAQGRAIVIFSDGEDHADRWSSRMERLRQQDIVVHAVSIGDAQEGHPVPTGKAAEPLTFQGETVLSKRSDTALEAIARGTGGTIVKLGLASGDLGTLYESKIEPLARRQHEASRLAGKAERFPLFLALGLRVADPRLFAGQPELALALELALDAAAGVGRACAASGLLPCSSLAAVRGGCRRRPTEVPAESARVGSGWGTAALRRRPVRGGSERIRDGDRACATLGGRAIQRRRHAVPAQTVCPGPAALPGSPPASRPALANEDRLRSGQYVARPG